MVAMILMEFSSFPAAWELVPKLVGIFEHLFKGTLGVSEKGFYYRPDHSESWYTYVKCHSEQLLLKDSFDFRPRKIF